MRKIKIIYSIIAIVSIFDTNVAISQRDLRRASKHIKTSDFANSSGLRTKLTKCAKGDSRCAEKQEKKIACGNNAQKNITETACECIDPINYIISATNPNECISKNDNYAITQRKQCGNALINAIEKECSESRFNQGLGQDGNLKCFDANDLFLRFDTSNIKVYIEGIAYEYDKICYMFTEELTKAISEDYAIIGPNSPNCKLKKAIAEASNECFQIVLSTGKAFNAIDSLEKTLQNTCGAIGIRSKWVKLYGDEDTSGIIFPTKIPEAYINAGKLTAANGIELTGNLLDGKITDRSNTWERDITMLLNSHLKEVGLACGQEYAISEHNTNIQLSNEKSSLQNAIDTYGSIKGSQIWTMNQASVIIGENKTNELIRNGILENSSNKEEESNKIEIIDNIETINEYEIGQNLQKIISTIPSGTNRYIIFSNSEYKFIDIKKETNASDKIEYSTIEYTDEMNIPSSILKKMINKTESTFEITNQPIEKGE